MRRRTGDRMSWRIAMANGAGLVLGAALDTVWGDPRRAHPVAMFGAAAARLERSLYRPRRGDGVRFASVAVGVPAVAAAACAMATRRRPWARLVLTAAVTWTVLGGRSLRQEALGISGALRADDTAAARARLPHLCGRDPEALDTTGLVRATVESLAENTSDAVVAPLCWGAMAGLPGLAAYRAINTLDAMVGHRSARYERFGWAVARLDDLANLLPSRLSAALTVAAAGMVGGSRRRALWIWLRDGHRHPSPNAGQCESALAGALDVRLGGRNHYRGRVEDRPVLGDGRPPRIDDISRAVWVSTAVGAATVLLAAGHAVTAPARRALVGRMRRRYGPLPGVSSRPVPRRRPVLTAALARFRRNGAA